LIPGLFLILSLLSRTAPEAWERICRPVPADSARPGLWACPRLDVTDGTRILVRCESDPSGPQRLEWSAERGLEAFHLPDATFWKILDGLAGPQGEWVERDPATLGKDSLPFRASLTQAFECRGCPTDWLAGTWGPFGAQRLLVVRRRAASPSGSGDSLALVPRASVDASVLEILTSLPCRDKGGACTEERRGPGDARWHLERPNSQTGWSRIRVEWESQPLGDSIPLAQLREDLPAGELALLLRNWLDAETDLFAANVLDPAPVLFTASGSDWRRRALRGFRLDAILAQVPHLAAFPDSVLLYDDGRCRAGIRGRLRWFEITR
jgi:hypothetical protein